MPLRIWLPLNGNYNNQGANGSTASSAGGSFVTSGKVTEQCWNSSAKAITIQYPYTSTNAITIATWVKPNSASQWSDVFGFGSTSTQNRFEQSVAAGGSTYNFYATASPIGANGVQLTTGLTNSVWHHLAMTADGAKLKFYLDGAKIYEGTQVNTVATAFGGATNIWVSGCATRSAYKGYFNDFRVYDHALSQKEVAELAKGMMLHIPMYAGYTGVGTNLCAGWREMQAKSLSQYYTVLLSDNNFFGLKVGDTYTYRLKITAPAEKGVRARVQYYTDGNTRTGPSSGITVAAGTTGYSYLTDTITEAKRAYTRMELLITSADTSVTTTNTAYVGEVKLELGSAPTPWSSSTDADYAIKDCSGYQASVSTSGSAVVATGNGLRYNSEVVLGETSYIQYPVPSGISQCTIAFWVKQSSGGGYSTVDCLKNNPGGSMWLAVNTESSKLWAYWGGTYNRVSGSLTANTWYHVALTFNAGVTQWYLDGVAVGSAVDFSARGTTWPSGTRTIGNSYTGSTWNTKFSGSFSDWRFYTTVLTAAQIKELYDAPISVANTGTCLAEQFTEGATGISFAKTGVVSCNGISSLPGKYDPEVLIEPDGSCWAHIGHHADPTTYKFASGDPFATGVWKDDRRFLDASYCDNVNKWEFMVIQKADSSASVKKYRWSQTKNPNTAVYEDVSSSAVTKNTSTGYTSFSTGGIYKFNSSAYYVTNNGSKGNWWGAIGAWDAHQGGIPGWAGTIVKDGGYLDLYLRIDNVTFSSGIAGCSLDKGGNGVLSPEFIEH